MLVANPTHMRGTMTKRFHGDPQQGIYPTLAEASAAAISLGITSSAEYQSRYKKDPCLPSNPPRHYASEWEGYPSFLGNPEQDRKRRKCFYPTLSQASAAAKKLRIKDSAEYKRRRKEDRKLPSEPYNYYREQWKGFKDFLGQPEKYRTLAEAKVATRRLGIKSAKEYQKRYRKDPRLPSNLHQTYKSEWTGVSDFFGKPEPKFYPTLADASAAAIALGITTGTEYQQRYQEDPLLPASPRTQYPAEWRGFPDFLSESSREESITLLKALPKRSGQKNSEVRVLRNRNDKG